jgi:hypothetical protein
MSKAPIVKTGSRSKVQNNFLVWDRVFNVFTERNTAKMLIAVGILFGVIEMVMNIRFGGGMFAFLISYPIYRLILKKPTRLPFFLPMSSGVKVDYENRKPIHDGDLKGLGKAEGVAYFGNDIETGKEIYMSNDVMKQHLLYLGTTGSGKTVGQATVASSFLIMGSGYSLTDGKADLKLPIDHMSRAWRMNRIDDIQMINYIRGEMDVWNKDPFSEIDSNSYHPYTSSSSDTLSEITKSLLDGDGDIWAKRAESYVPAMIRPNVFRRDKQNMNLTVDVLSDMLILEEAGKVLGDETIPDYAKSQLLKFIQTLPGMNEAAKKTIMQGKSLTGREGATILDQFGYVVMQIIPVMNMLAGDYGFIFNSKEAPRGHIDMEDVVLNRRILLILLPALETSPSSLASLGRITLAAQKSMMAKSLGNSFAGETAKNSSGRPTSSPTSFLSDNDEVGYYLTEGTAVAAAQARSIGFSLLYGAQDLSAMRRLSDMVSKEVDSIWGNTNIKLFARVLDNATTDEITKYVGEDYYARKDRYSANDSGMSTSYKSDSVSMQKESRLDIADLQNLIEGEVYIHYVGKMFLVRIPMLVTEELDYVLLNNYITLENTSSRKAVSVDNYQRFMKSAIEYMKDKEEGNNIEFNESNMSFTQYLKGISSIANVVTNPLDLGPTLATTIQMKFELEINLLTESDEPAIEDKKQVAVEVEIGFDDDGLPVPIQKEGNIDEQDFNEFDNEDFTEIVEGFANDSPIPSDDNADEEIVTSNIKLDTADSVISSTQGIFDEIFGVTGKNTIKEKVAKITDSVTGNKDGEVRANNMLNKIESHVRHPSPPTLERNPAKSKELLKSLINVIYEENEGAS